MSLSLRLPAPSKPNRAPVKPSKPVRLALAASAPMSVSVPVSTSVPAVSSVPATEEHASVVDEVKKVKKPRRPRQPPYTFDQVHEELTTTLKSLSAQLAQTKRLVNKLNTAHRAESTTTRSRSRKPTGFFCPTKLDAKMRDFLSRTTDEDRSITVNDEVQVIPKAIGEEDMFLRHMITKVIHNYLKRNSLRNEGDKRILLYKDDPELWDLFLTEKPEDRDAELMNGIREGTADLTYLMLQRVLKYRYVK